MAMSNDMRAGWFSVKRGMLDHDLFKPDGKWSKAEAWIWLIENAAISEKTVDIGGRPHVVKRGSLAYSLRFLADKWSWSVKAVRTFLATLEKHGAVKLEIVGNEKGTGRTQVTLCNYDKYQQSGHAKGTEGAQKGHKEEQETNIPPSEGAAAPDLKSVDVDPINKAVWDFGVPFLSSRGVKNPRPIIGGWLRDHQTPMAVLEALRDAQKAATQDPVPYVKAILKGGQSQVKAKRGDLKATRDGRVLEWDGWTWEPRNDLTPEDIAHAV